MNEHQTAAPVVIILGMHCSGTSCLAGSLQEAGLYLGDVNERARYNAKGSQENRAIMSLNDAILTANSAKWDDPPDTVVWHWRHKRRRDRLIRSYTSDKTWGFKDPRTLLHTRRLAGIAPIGTMRWNISPSVGGGHVTKSPHRILNGKKLLTLDELQFILTQIPACVRVRFGML